MTRAVFSSLVRTLLLSVGVFGTLMPPVGAGETTNKYGITMVDIPAGSFLMGSCKVPSSEAGRIAEENKKRAFLGQAPIAANLNCELIDSEAGDSETPQHRVSVKAFQMGKTEVTLGQFKQFIAAAGRSDLVNDEFMKYNRYGDDVPVVMVSWHDAQDFIKWLNKADGGGWRLPSEAEWEYACKGGTTSRYCGGDNPGALAWYDRNGGERQRPVGGKQSNAFGLYDMSGNVWEWVEDCMHDSYRGAPTDGKVWGGGDCGRHVLRGGSWINIPYHLRAANRNYGNRDYDFGFRVARTRP